MLQTSSQTHPSTNMEIIMDIKSIGEYLKKAATGNNESVDSEGGYLVTHEIVDRIYDVLKLTSPMYDKAQKFTLSGGRGANGLKIPYNNSALTTEPSTGARAYWVKEAAQKTISKPQIGMSDISTEKLVVRIPVTDELNSDSSVLAQYVIDQAAKAIKNAIEYYMIHGASDEAIKGIANAADKATLASNAAADVTEAELVGFVDKLNPIYLNSAEWYVSPQQFSVICMINYTSENTLQFEGGQYWLFGMPVNVSPLLVADPYHIILGDWSVYGIVQKEIQIARSEHIRFDYDETEFRLVMRIGGDVLAETQVLNDGVTYAAFVVPTDGEANASSSSSSSSSSQSSSSSSSSSVDSSSSSSSVDSSSSSSN